MLNGVFDHAYCLNLLKRRDRRTRCSAIFDSYGWGVEFFLALDGARLYNQTRLLAGELGAAASHLAIIEDAKLKGYKRILVMEDDVEFCDDFLRVWEDSYKDVPDDWKMLYGGANHERPYTRITDKVVKCNFAFTLHFVGIDVALFDEIGGISVSKPIDVHYAELHSKYPVYAFSPPIVWQETGYSDIQRKNVDYEVLRRP